MQFIMDNSLQNPTDAQDGRPSAEWHSCQNCLAWSGKIILGCSLSNRVFSVDRINVSGGLCSFGASIELVKQKVSEMFIFLNLTLHGFGPENFVTLFQIGEFPKSLIEETKSYKMVYHT
jgi:hypothetical protein